MKQKPFFIIHAIGDSPKVELVPDIHVVQGTAYIVAPNEAYTILKTDEQKDTYIKSLESRLGKAEGVLRNIAAALYPDQESDN